MYPFESIFLYPLGKYLVVQLLYHRVVLFLTFSGASILFSRVDAPVCTFTNSVREVPFLCMLNICYFLCGCIYLGPFSFIFGKSGQRIINFIIFISDSAHGFIDLLCCGFCLFLYHLFSNIYYFLSSTGFGRCLFFFFQLLYM